MIRKNNIWQIISSDLFSSSFPLPSIGDTLTKGNTENIVTSIDESTNKIFVEVLGREAEFGVWSLSYTGVPAPKDKLQDSHRKS